MSTEQYTPPVSQLLSFAGEKASAEDEWPDYLALGFEPEHIPELIRLATDETLLSKERDDFALYAPLHAMRTLGQLKAEAAIEPLLPLFDAGTEDGGWIYDWIAEDLARVYGMIGPAALPTLSAYLRQPSHEDRQSYVADAISEIAQNYPEARAEAIATLTHELEQFEQNGYELNTFLIANLVELKAVEALPTIQQAFEANRVETIFMDWDYVQIAMGLKEPEEPSFSLPTLSSTSISASFPGRASHLGSASKKEKNKRKMAKQSRKKNKRKK